MMLREKARFAPCAPPRSGWLGAIVRRGLCWFFVAAMVGGPAIRPALAQDAPLAASLPDLTHITDASRAEVERAAVQYLRAVQAMAIDPDLPDGRLDRWLESVLRLPSSWQMTDCGAERRNGHGPVCVRVTQSSRGVDLLLLIGDDERGVTGRPRLVAGDVRLFDIDSRLPRLAALPDTLIEADARRQRFADHPLQPLTAADLARLRSTTPVQALEPELPDLTVDRWLSTVLGRDVTAEWTLISCNPNPQAAAPQCANVDVRWPDGARARITLDLEMVQRGLAVVPSFRMAFLFRGAADRAVEPYRSLPAFADALRGLASPPR